MDPFSGAASVIAVIQIAGAVIDLCYRYRSSLKDAPKTITRLMNEVRGVRVVLESLDTILAEEQSSGTAHLLALEEVMKGNGLLSQCSEELENLKKVLEPKQGLRAIGQVLKWPMTEKDVNKTLQCLQRLNALFRLALAGDHTKLLVAIQSDTNAVKGDTTELRRVLACKVKVDMDEKVFSWLSAPDLTVDHENVKKKRQPETGLWFTNGGDFKRWKTGQQSLIWLYGIPGCGKTVLSSSIIEKTLLDTGSDSDVVVAYFYFTFNDPAKQTCDSLLRSLIFQILSSRSISEKSLSRLHNDCHGGMRQPTISELTGLLKEMLESIPSMYLILDALDECTDREDLLRLLKDINMWSQTNTRILVTSREEQDIKHALKAFATTSISIQGSGVDADIYKYIEERLLSDPKLARWKGDDRREITSTISQSSQGMFRWAACQLDAISSCRNRVSLTKTLKALPKDLHETYSRILQNVKEDDLEYAIKVLNFLALAARPVLLAEVADFIAMDLENRRIGVDAQFQDPQDILTICSSLVTSTESSWHSVAEINECACEDALRRRRLSGRIKSHLLSRKYPGEQLKLAHLSVKEWILSSTYTEIVTTRVGVSPKGPDLVAQTCLAYLLQFNTLRNFTKTSIAEYPFLNYAVYHWLHHVETCLTENSSLTTKQMACDLTKLNQVQFLNVAFVFNEACYHQPDRPWRSHGRSPVARWRDYVHAAKTSGETWDFASPLYWAAQFGKRKVCELLIAEGADPNASGGPIDTPLNAAIAEGHDSVVQLLITSGADIEPRSGHQYSPLQHACMKLNLEVVKVLINAKVNVNAIGEESASALALAVDWGDNGAILQLLLDAGANLNLREWPDIKLLRMACNSWEGAENGNEVVVKMLLNHGADIHYGQDTGDTALALAVERGNLPAVRLLVEKGASLRTQNRKRRTLLMEACCYREDQGREEIVRHLINNGADINTQVEENTERNALCTSLAKNAGTTVVRLLLEHGADPNLTGGREKTPLQIASKAGGSGEVIALLLQYGANENGLLRHCSTALQEAAFTGRDTIVALLLDRGANVNQIAGQYSTALCAAAYCGHAKVVRRLLSNGADVDIRNDHGWTATAFAFVQGHGHVLKELAESNLNPRSPLSNRGLPPDSVLAADSSSNITISLDENTRASAIAPMDLVQVRANHPAPPTNRIFYYEVEIVRQGMKGVIGIGMCDGSAPSASMPGWNEGSWGYHGDDGKKFLWYGNRLYGPTYGKGDVVGCGFEYCTKSIFFTKNGEHLGLAATAMPGILFAVVATGEQETQLKFNFGTKPFVYEGLEEQNRLLADGNYYVAERVKLSEI